MPIGTPQKLILVSNSANSTHVTVTSTAPAGSLIVVACACWSSTNGVVSSVTDSQGNSYTIVQNAAAASVPYPGAIAYCLNSASTLTSGIDWISVTSTAVSQSTGAWSMSGANSGIDVSIPTTGFGIKGKTISTGTLAQNNEIIFGLTATAGNLSGFTNSAGFTELAFGIAGSGNAFGFAYDIVSSTSSVSYSPTWTNNNNVALVLVSFKGLSVSSGIHNLPFHVTFGQLKSF